MHGQLTTGDTTGLGQIMDCKEFSSLDRLLSTTDVVLRFCKILLDQSRPNGAATSNSATNLTAEELWILECQRMIVADKNFKQWQKQLDLFQDEKGVWRCRGRIQNATIPYSTKHPCFFTRAITLPCCLSERPTAVFFMLESRKPWQSYARSSGLSRGEISSRASSISVTCARHEGEPYSAPPPPPLPTFRVEEAPPFFFTGVDFAGPLYVRSDSAAKKVWICLYT